jgi:hypothetical protein
MSKGTLEKPYKGIKGQSELSEIIEFPRDLMIDSMHLLSLGVFKLLLKKWFDSTNNQQVYSL